MMADDAMLNYCYTAVWPSDLMAFVHYSCKRSPKAPIEYYSCRSGIKTL